mmetsp:Transcript_81384/g.242572  ORF Transcript_81384/g.242572 Transcript_81384/m.242572 type:complete len:269 (+) Transcript_81384:117-923(+)
MARIRGRSFSLGPHLHKEKQDRESGNQQGDDDFPDLVDIVRGEGTFPLLLDLSHDVKLVGKHTVDVAHLIFVPLLVQEGQVPIDVVQVVEECEAKRIEQYVLGAIFRNDEQKTQADTTHDQTEPVGHRPKVEPRHLGRVVVRHARCSLKDLAHVDHLPGVLLVLPKDVQSVGREEQDEEHAQQALRHVRKAVFEGPILVLKRFLVPEKLAIREELNAVEAIEENGNWSYDLANDHDDEADHDKGARLVLKEAGTVPEVCQRAVHVQVS